MIDVFTEFTRKGLLGKLLCVDDLVLKSETMASGLRLKIGRKLLSAS